MSNSNLNPPSRWIYSPLDQRAYRPAAGHATGEANKTVQAAPDICRDPLVDMWTCDCDPRLWINATSRAAADLDDLSGVGLSRFARLCNCSKKTQQLQA